MEPRDLAEIKSPARVSDLTERSRNSGYATPSPFHPPTGMPFSKCDRCGKDVRRMEHWPDHRTGETVFRVRCHGEVEDMRLPASALTSGAFLTRGGAFQQVQFQVVNQAQITQWNLLSPNP